MRDAASHATTRVTLAALCAGLTACASAQHEGYRPPEPEFVVGSNGWISGALLPSGPATDGVGCHSAWRNHALRAEDPWVGTIGVRQELPGDCELGLGLALPSSYFGVSESLADQPDDLGVGLWLKIDF